MAIRSRKNGTLVISLILSCFVFFLCLSALQAIEQGQIWNFLLYSGSGLTLVLAPKDNEFFKRKISSLSDMTKPGLYTDPITAAFLTMAEFMIVAGMLGLLFGW